ncbi:MAG: hypothetical protein IIA44_08095, partial [Acidobacteria bacterium]|nr:hypothetical protein [Acidobacteriota bacterium]
ELWGYLSNVAAAYQRRRYSSVRLRLDSSRDATVRAAAERIAAAHVALRGVSEQDYYADQAGGAAAIDVNIQTRHRATGSWVDDRSTLSAYRIDANQLKTFIIDRDAHFIRVRGRVAGMVAATTTSDVVVQYRARPHLGGSDEGVSAESHQIRPASGALTAAETGTPLIVPSWATKAAIRLDITTITTADGDDEVDWYVQTSYNRGADWADVANVHVANAENGNTELHLLTIDRAQTNVGVVTESDGTLADDTRLNIPLGDRIRIRTAVTGATAPTYAYNAEVLFLA